MPDGQTIDATGTTTNIDRVGTNRITLAFANRRVSIDLDDATALKLGQALVQVATEGKKK